MRRASILGALSVTLVVLGFTSSVSLAAPPSGFSLHLVAKAGCVVGSANHHYIKKVNDDMLVALLYESEADEAVPVAVELIMTKTGYDKLPAKMKKLYHSHKPEVDKGEVTLPGMSPEDVKKTLAFVSTTYGRVITFDQMTKSPELKAVGHAH